MPGIVGSAVTRLLFTSSASSGLLNSTVKVALVGHSPPLHPQYELTMRRAP